MTSVFFIRDLIFYFAVTIYLLIITLVIEKMNLLIALGFLAMYSLYVILVVYQAKRYPSIGAQGEEENKD